MFLQIKKNLQKYNIDKNTKVVLSISGGVDSVVLYFIIKKIINPKNIHLLHFNYNFHLNADKAESFINDIAIKYNSIFKSYKIKLNNNNFEATARLFRYNKLNEYAMNEDVKYILTAHHENDQMETLLMKDLTNCDWISYLGIREQYNRILRPMLKFTKSDILEYAKEKKIVWIEDLSNKNKNFLRNRLRYNLKNKYYSKTYLSSLLKKHKNSKIEMENFNSFFEKKYNELIIENSYNLVFQKKILEHYSRSYLKLFIYKIINKKFNVKIVISNSHIFQFEKFISDSIHGNLFVLYKNINILNNRGEFLIYKNSKVNLDRKILVEQNVRWYKTSFITKEDKRNINCLDSIKCPLDIYEKGIFITHWQKGDCMKINKDNVEITKKISDIFIDNKVSQVDKKYYPILRDSNNQIIWIPKLESNLVQNLSFSKQIFWVEN
tara:strand:- start:747 stop:2057 length:1311 start_codon:yes stop_codon:yes gene_type:complete